MSQSHNDRVNRYYRDSTSFYRWLWGGRNLSMHYGFWDEDTRNIDDAFVNENRYAAEALNLQGGDSVLDAGCGIGGTAIWLAQNYDCKVTGITITPEHVPLATKYAAKRGVGERCTFEVRDYCDTGLPSESFDKVYGIESICHAEDKSDFAREAFRLLKPGGRLAVCDGFRAKDILTDVQEGYYREMLEGWALSGLASVGSFSDDLAGAGFHNVMFTEATAKIMKSSKEMHDSSVWIHPLVVGAAKVGLTAETNVLAEITCHAQYHLFQDGVTVYGIFTAEK